MTKFYGSYHEIYFSLCKRNISSGNCWRTWLCYGNWWKKLVEIEKCKQTNKEEKKQENEKAEIKWNKFALHILTVYFSLCSQ